MVPENSKPDVLNITWKAFKTTGPCGDNCTRFYGVDVGSGGGELLSAHAWTK